MGADAAPVVGVLFGAASAGQSLYNGDPGKALQTVGETIGGVVGSSLAGAGAETAELGLAGTFVAEAGGALAGTLFGGLAVVGGGLIVVGVAGGRPTIFTDGGDIPVRC